MRIRWTEPAARDLTNTNICDYTEEHDGPEAARRVALRIYEGVGALLKFPHRCRPGRKPGARELVFSGLPFLGGLHGAQRWP
jgi:plasmid stabilization system protein ParE